MMNSAMMLDVPADRPIRGPRSRYRAPTSAVELSLRDLVLSCGRTISDDRQFELLSGKGKRDAPVFCAGRPDILKAPAVSIVGTREVSEEGRRRAARLARELAAEGVVVMSGLAKGVDTAAHLGAIEQHGRTVAVIGTPLEKAYPAENAELQEEIYERHLLVSPFAPGETVFKGNFPKRNRVMALLSDATVIVEASDTSGTLHQAAECQRLGRWLFIMKSVADDARLTWPSGFIGKPKVKVLASTQDILDAIRAGHS